MSESVKQSNIQILNKKIEKFDDVNSLKFEHLSILSMIRENNRKNSTKTVYSSSYIRLKEYEINKFDELNKSFGNISNFDLEKEDNSNDLSFNSSEDDDKFEALEIIISKKINKKNKDKNKEFEIELDKEFEEIKKEVNKNKSKD